jgi:hypothetical protein
LTPSGIVQAQAMTTKEVLILCFETDGSLKLPPEDFSEGIKQKVTPPKD